MIENIFEFPNPTKTIETYKRTLPLKNSNPTKPNNKKARLTLKNFLLEQCARINTPAKHPTVRNKK
ncbi:MAG: hypothetical protein BACD_01390 [Bacteroides rodentium]